MLGFQGQSVLPGIVTPATSMAASTGGSSSRPHRTAVRGDRAPASTGCRPEVTAPFNQPAAPGPRPTPAMAYRGRVHVEPAPPPRLVGAHSLAQTTLPGDPGPWRALVAPGRLDALVRTPEDAGVPVHHYRRSQTRPDRPWLRGPALAADTTGPAALAQRPGPRGRGLLDALVPEPGGLVHHTFDPDAAHPAWVRGATLADAPAEAALLAGRDGVHALVAVAGRLEHHRLDRGGRAWTAPDRLTALGDGVVAAALARAPRWFAAGRPGLVAVAEAAGRLALLTLGPRGWSDPDDLGPAGSAPPALAALDGGLVLAVPRGDRLDVRRWTPAGWAAEASLVAGDAVRAVALTASALDGWVQSLTQEDLSVFQSHRQTVGAGVRWARSSCLRLTDLEPVVTDPEPSVKVAQVSGERDSQPYRDGPRPTLSRSESRAGVRGTDLGVRVEHAGASYLLFGDTHWSSPLRGTLDAVARLTPEGPVAGAPGVEFHGSPLRLQGWGVTSREYDVPLDAFSLGDDWFVFHTSNHFRRHQVMGRSLLTRAVDDPATISGAARRRPFRLRVLGPFSDWRFVNVSAVVEGETLWLWGSGSYRADDLRLARLDLGSDAVRAALRGRRLPRGGLPVEYWAGADADGPRWSDAEADAAPLFGPGAFGEISVRWSPEVGRWLLLAMPGPEDPIGPAVTLRTASEPWGPWSPRRRLLDWVAGGMAHHDAAARFIRAHDDDEVGDRIFSAQASMTGAAYAPYLFDTRLDGDDLVLRYTLSTWNPYQVVLMEHRTPWRELGEPPDHAPV